MVSLVGQRRKESEVWESDVNKVSIVPSSIMWGKSSSDYGKGSTDKQIEIKDVADGREQLLRV